MSVSWRQLWDTTATLTGRVEARWLCEEACGQTGSDFIAVLDAAAGELSVAHLDAMVARHRAGEPLQYVLGHWSFRRLDLLVDRRVLIPRPETELVAERAIALVGHMAVDGGRWPLIVADLGTGTGAIGLSLATELPSGMVEVWLTDLSPDALDVARANTAGVGNAGTCVRFGQGDWYQALPTRLRGELALVVSNPPYIAPDDQAIEAAVRDWEPAAALFAADDGLAAIRVVIAGAAEWLTPGGWLVLEIGAGQGAAVLQLLNASAFEQTAVTQDLAGHDRIAAGCYVP
ncbi:MAG: peptide chain release factor N(5)-glutamine methyltransferase [Actinobacteria bacterium]|nr:peptide chain release factor N(5)-glutamine methyltransferase [Actinomycetota bacterium]